MSLDFMKGAPQEVDFFFYPTLISSLFVDLRAFGLDLDLDLNEGERTPIQIL